MIRKLVRRCPGSPQCWMRVTRACSGTTAAGGAGLPVTEHVEVTQPPLRHPVVLQPGIFGFSSIGEHLDYFDGVELHLQQSGHKVYVADNVMPISGVRDRAKGLEEFILQEVLPKHPEFSKVHLIGHSMGGLDGRYLIQGKDRPTATYIKTLSTVCTPHQGTLVAQMGAQLLSTKIGLNPVTWLQAAMNPKQLRIVWSIAEAVMAIIARSVAAGIRHPVQEILRDWNHLKDRHKVAMDILSDKGHTRLLKYLVSVTKLPLDALLDLTPERVVTLFDPNRDFSHIPCFSYAAVADVRTMAPELDLTAELLRRAMGPNVLSDGLVSVESATWQQFMGTFPSDHNGVHGWFDVPHNCHLQFFGQIIANLRPYDGDDDHPPAHEHVPAPQKPPPPPAEATTLL